MAWTTPTVRATGDLITPAIWNGEIVGNMNYLYGTTLSYRKTTAKQVVNSVAATDLLNGEVTVGAGVLGLTGVLRLTAWGDMLNNTGGNQNTPTFTAALGGTSVAVIATLPAAMSSGSTRTPWRIVVEIMNLGAANSQWSTATLLATFAMVSAAAAAGSAEGYTYAPAPVGGVAPVIAVSAGATAVDTSAAKALTLSVTNPVASANYDVTLKCALVEIDSVG